MKRRETGTVLFSHIRAENVKREPSPFHMLLCESDLLCNFFAEKASVAVNNHVNSINLSLYSLNSLYKNCLTVFRDEDWLAMVDYVTVTEDTGITVAFKDGTEIEA